MSDPNAAGSGDNAWSPSIVPPPPPPAAGVLPPPPPPPAADASPPPPPGFHPSFGSSTAPRSVTGGAIVERPDRPAVPIGGWLLVLGGVLAIVACFLPWASVAGGSVNGFDDFLSRQDNKLLIYRSPGRIPLVLGIVLAVFGVITLVARRFVAVAILAIVVAIFTALISIGLVGIYSNGVGPTDISAPKIGAGTFVAVVGGLVALAGAIVTTVKRRS